MYPESQTARPKPHSRRQSVVTIAFGDERPAVADVLAPELPAESTHRQEAFSANNEEALRQLLRSPFVDAKCLLEHFGLTRNDEDVFVEIYGAIPPQDRPSLSPYFDQAFYLAANPDVAQKSVDPLLHFITSGLQELRHPHPFLDLRWIAATDLSGFGKTRTPELLLATIESEVFRSGPYFDPAFYRAQAMSSDEANTPALRHFIEKGMDQGSAPNPYLIPKWYRKRYPDVPPSDREAVLHFVREGDSQARYPGPGFDPDWYRSAYPDVRKEGFPPLLHFLALGRAKAHLPVNPSLESLLRPAQKQPTKNAAEVEVWSDPFAPLANYRALKAKIARRRQDQIEAFVEHDVRPFSIRDPLKTLAFLEFPEASSPRVSILVPVYNELDYTVECLASIADSKARVSYEVLIADDASPDDNVRRLSEVPNLRYLRQPKNVGFLKNCNSAFAEVRGEFVLLLNNDAQITPGVLDSMVAVLDEHPDVAAVGPKLLYPNGRLQEAGCHIGRDGSSSMVGLFHDPATPVYSYSRDVDYCSGAAVMVRTSEVGDILFDEQFAPAYCEDVDLCLRLISKGRRIRYCAEATVIHHLSVSTAKASQTRKLQTVVANQQKLLAKWGDIIENLNTARVIAFYLPQFHPIPENDLWWGKGFTEWTNVSKAEPSYEGQYQPHLPSDLGFYDLRVPAVMRSQFRLAQRYGIDGFCLYYYNFGGHRLLQTPAEELVADPSIPFKFCVCWANENWTKHWDGGEKEILLAQDYSEETLRSIAADVLRYANDQRYIRVDDKPLLLVYRPLLLPDPIAAATLIRRTFAEEGMCVHLVYVESMEAIERGVRPEDIGFDACVEFPPQGIAVARTDEVTVLKEGWAGLRYDYPGTVVEAVMRKGVPYKRYPGVFASWDNTARQPLKCTSFDDVSPEAFQLYLEQKLEEARTFLPTNERFIFVNAWNEWAEGAHLEPDRRYGHRWLEAVRNALLSQ
jgi:GT2 family glycosyltransferase